MAYNLHVSGWFTSVSRHSRKVSSGQERLSTDRSSSLLPSCSPPRVALQILRASLAYFCMIASDLIEAEGDGTRVPDV